MPDSIFQFPLPAVDSADSVEVVDLAGLNVGAHDFVTRAGAASAITLNADDAIRVIKLWGYLPAAGQARCHLPPFGLRFYSKGVVICQASICWQCNNIFGQRGNGEGFHFQFDGSHQISRRLLEIFEKAVGHSAVEEF